MIIAQYNKSGNSNMKISNLLLEVECTGTGMIAICKKRTNKKIKAVIIAKD